MVEAGDRVDVANRGRGVVRFVGETQFAPGLTWFGVELEGPTGKNDGSVQEVRYFSCAENHGCFVKEDALTKLASSESEAGAEKAGGADGGDAKPSPSPPSPATPVKSPSPAAADTTAATSADRARGATPVATESSAAEPAAAASTPGLRPGLSKIQAAREKKRALAQRLQRNAATTPRTSPSKPSAPAASPAKAASPPPAPAPAPVPAVEAESPAKSADAAAHAELTARAQALEAALAESKDQAEAQESALRTEIESLREELEKSADRQAKADSALDAEKLLRAELEAKVRTLTSQLERAEMDVEAKAKASSAKQERTLEKQAKELEELNALVETLTLDKEQLEMDKDIAEEKATEMELELEQLKLDVEEERMRVAEEREAAVAAATAQATAASVPQGAEEISAQLVRVTEENGKLREALKRLHAASTAEKTEAARQVRALTKERDSLAQSAAQLETETQAKKKLEDEVEELTSMLDTAQAYEDMVESLSEKNLELADENAALKEANDELEELRLLSEEVEQQHADLQQQLERDMETNRTEMVNAQLEAEALRRDVGARDEALEKLRAVVLEGQKREGGLRDELAVIASLELQLQQAKENARTANLALLSETESKLAQTIGMYKGQADARRAAFRVACMQTVVPASIMGDGSAVLESLSLAMDVVDSSGLLVSLIMRAGLAKQVNAWDDDAAPPSARKLVPALLSAHSCATHLWLSSRTPELPFAALEGAAASLVSLLQQMSQGVGQLLAIVQRGDRGLAQLAADEEANQVGVVDRLLKSACATYATVAAKVAAAAPDGVQVPPQAPCPYESVRSIQVALCAREEAQGGEDELALAPLESACYELAAAASAMEFSDALAQWPLDAADVAALARLAGDPAALVGDADKIGTLAATRAKFQSAKAAVEQGAGTSAGGGDAVPPLWREHASVVEDILEQAAATRSELENVKSALKRRVMEAHSKTTEVQALQVVRSELEEKLDAARGALKDQDALQKECARLEAQVRAKEVEVEQALSVAREQSTQAAPARDVVEPAAPSPEKQPPQQRGASASASAAATVSPGGLTEGLAEGSPTGDGRAVDNVIVHALQDEVAFWRGRAVHSQLGKLAPLTFAPRARYSGGALPRRARGAGSLRGGEDTLNAARAAQLERGALLAQASARIPDLGRAPEMSVRRQVLDAQAQARAIAKRLAGLQVMRSVAPAKGAEARVGRRPRQVGRLTLGQSSTGDALQQPAVGPPTKVLLTRKELDGLFGRVPTAA